MTRKDRKLTKWHQDQVVKLDWVAGAVAKYYFHKKSLGNATSFEDLKQIAYRGICAAVYDWKENAGKSISSYAYDRAKAYIGHYMRDKSRLIKVPRKVQRLYYLYLELKNINPLKSDLIIAEELGVTLDELIDAKKVSVSMPTEFFPETMEEKLNVIENNNLKQLNPRLNYALNLISKSFNDKDLGLYFKYIKGEVKNKKDVNKIEDLIIEAKSKILFNGFKQEDLDDLIS